MGCFPACFGHVRRDLATKKVQHQCLSPSNEQHESVKLLPEKTESLKEEIVNPIQLFSQVTEDISKEEETASDHSNVKKISNEVASSSKSDSNLVEYENGKVEMGREKEKENIFNKDLLVNEKECFAKETSSPVVQEESCCSSLFTLSIDSRKQFLAAEMGDKEVSSLLKINNNNNNNTSSKTEDQEKGNLKDPMIEQCSFDKSKSGSDRPCRGKDNEMAVEMSLSSWLVETEKSPQKNMSVGSSPESENNYGDRQILRVIADINKLNRVVSSTTTSCCSSDDQLGVGTVGRYWRQRGTAREVADGEVSSVGTIALGSVEAS